MKFSIITPSFRQLDWLRLCIASVRDQAHEGSGIAVEHWVQDAGTPGLDAFAEEVGARLVDEDGGPPAAPEGLVISRGADAGMYDAINRGLRRTTGDVCAYLNCDEQYLPGTLPWVAAWFRDNPRTDVLFCATIVVDDRGRYVCDRRATLPTVAHTRTSANLAIATASTFFRRSLLVGPGFWFDATWRALGDAEWVTRLVGAGVSLAIEPRPVSIHTDTGSNLAFSPVAKREAGRLAATAPWWQRKTWPVAVLAHRLRRWRAGAYTIEPHGYEVFTRESPARRIAFEVPHPTFRWVR